MSAPEGRRACVIGAGFGGLALAIRLQAAGIQTTVVEARDRPGGRATGWQQGGFAFEGGPTLLADTQDLRTLWELTGHDIADDLELLPVTPSYRLNWPDGTNFEPSPDPVQLRREVARIDPADVDGYEAFLRQANHLERDSPLRAEPFLNLAAMMRAAPPLARQQAWRSLYGTAVQYVGNEKLREALSFHALLAGANPLTLSGHLAPLHALHSGVFWPRGGTSRLIAAMVRHFERLGGELRLGEAAVSIDTLGVRCTEVETVSGWRGRFDAVASNADVVHTYRDLLGGTLRGQTMGRKLAAKRFSPSFFVIHFGIEGGWPGIPHHMMLFGSRYEGMLEDIYVHGVLPKDLPIYLHHPTVTDPSMAPQGRSAFSAVVPVPHLGKLAVDWQQLAPMLETRILDEVGRRLIPDIHDRLVTCFHYTPRDFAAEFNTHLGSAFSLEPTFAQSAWLRPHNRDDVLRNFYLVGAGTHPGVGVAGVLAGARITAGLMLEDMAA